MISLKVRKSLEAAIVISWPGARKKTATTRYDLTILVLSHKFCLRKLVQDKTRCAREHVLARDASDFRSNSLTCIGNQQTAKMATTTMTMRVTLFFPLRLSADTWPPGAAPRHSRSSSHRYRPQISARGVTYDVAKKIICTQRTLVSVDPANRCCYVFKLLATGEFCIFPSAV